MGTKAVRPHAPPPEPSAALWPPSQGGHSRMPESGLGGTGGGGNQPDTPCQQALNLPIGSWHRFVEGKTCIDAQLAWRSVGGGVLIFTDAKGQRLKILSANTVELMLRAGTLQSLTQHTR